MLRNATEKITSDVATCTSVCWKSIFAVLINIFGLPASLTQHRFDFDLSPGMLKH